MSELVPTTDIEKRVGHRRREDRHMGRADTHDEMIYILHSHECLNSGIDLRECEFSVALDRGILYQDWFRKADRAVLLEVVNGRLKPL